MSVSERPFQRSAAHTESQSLLVGVPLQRVPQVLISEAHHCAAIASVSLSCHQIMRAAGGTRTSHGRVDRVGVNGGVGRSSSTLRSDEAGEKRDGDC